MANFFDKFSQFRAQWDRLSMRERRMISVLAGAVLSMLGILLVYFVWSGLADLQEHNELARQALRDIAEHREEFRQAKQNIDALEVRVSRTPVQLTSLLYAAAGESNVKIEQTNERQPTARGKKYLERGVDIKIRKADLQSLTKFLKKIESGANLVVVEKLVVKPVYNQHDQLDAEVGVLTFEFAQPEQKKPPEKKGDKG